MGKSGNLLEAGRVPPAGSLSPYVATREELRAAVDYMGSYSLYAAEEEIRQGFITIQGGHRIGVAGRVVADRQGVRLMKFNLLCQCAGGPPGEGLCGRNHAVSVRAAPGQPGPHFCNTLIISPPRCGKTTLLRDVIRQFPPETPLRRG